MRNLFFDEPDGELPEYAPSSALCVAINTNPSDNSTVETRSHIVLNYSRHILIVKVLRKKKYNKYNLDAMKHSLERSKRYPIIMRRYTSFPLEQYVGFHGQLRGSYFRFLMIQQMKS
ncbi:hypothetical protein Ahy_B06g082562 [Arachis hypogaea]|uniref:Uncharacterized protein n=1 Tax=Arachis hypogaea TaxID=3818 RepID=A0A444YNJ9_ARAHY|nr:hypothetical protein Ahy_B06g082562 [Arachis hypogaea]